MQRWDKIRFQDYLLSPVVFPLERGCWYPFWRAPVPFTGSSDLRNRWCFGALLKKSIHNNHFKTSWFLFFLIFPSIFQHVKRQRREVSCVYFYWKSVMDWSWHHFVLQRLSLDIITVTKRVPLPRTSAGAVPGNSGMPSLSQKGFMDYRAEPAPGLRRSQKVSALGMPWHSCFGRDPGICIHPRTSLKKKKKFNFNNQWLSEVL